MRVVEVRSADADAAPIRVMLAEISAACGWPSAAQDYATTEFNLNEHLIKNPVSTYLMRVSGDSMMRSGIFDGDEIVVDCSVRPREGDVVVVTIDGEMTVKRFSVRDGQVVLSPDNPNYPEIVVPELADVRIWGVVVRGLRHVIERPY